jgi:diketogulonate reductase-like aldo/keto reductase
MKQSTEDKAKGIPEPCSAGLRVLQELAELQHVTPRQIALQFFVRCPGFFAIPKASTPEQTTEVDTGPA